MDQEYFTAQAEASTGLLYRVAYTILRNDADCQDAVQEALLRAWTGRDKLRDRQLFRTWLTRILINASHDILRKRKPTVPLENARRSRDEKVNQSQGFHRHGRGVRRRGLQVVEERLSRHHGGA